MTDGIGDPWAGLRVTLNREASCPLSRQSKLSKPQALNQDIAWRVTVNGAADL